MKALHRAGTVLCIVGLVCCLLTGLLCGSVSAANGDVSLTLLCKTANGQALQGMHWEIYAVGGRGQDDQLELRGDFADFPVSLADTSATGLSIAAQTLENLAILNHLIPLDAQTANEYGTLCFEGLETGLYLVTGETLRLDDTYYIPTAFLAEIPADGSVVDFSAHPKYLSVDANRESWDYTVKKIWSNTDAQPEDHSDSVAVQIYRNGELVNTVDLSDENDWSYAWSADEFYDWRVLEIRVSEKYYVVYRSNETQYVIVNTYNSDYHNAFTQTTRELSHTTTTTETTGSAMTQTGNGMVTTAWLSGENSDTMTQPISTGVSTTAAAVNGDAIEKLPQTGQLWWPVPILGAAGLLLMAIGLRLRTKE